MNRESSHCLTWLCVLAAFATGLAFAQAPASKPVAGSVNASEPVSRMFFTPAQRASLDVARTQRARTNLSTDRTEETAPQAQVITYGGSVRRSDGKSTVWINGRSINENDNLGGSSIVGRVRPDGSITLTVPQSGRSADLKPGQSIDLLSGTLEEAYSRKPIVAEPKPAPKGATDAKPAAKPEASDRAAEELAREERQQQRVEEAVSRALQETANARPAGAAPPPPAQPAR